MNNVESLGYQIETEIEKLPPLPSAIRYLDDFSEDWRSIQAPSTSSKWIIQADGCKWAIDFDKFEGRLSRLLKHWAAWAFAKLSPSTVDSYYQGLLAIQRQDGPEVFLKVLSLSPLELREEWHQIVLPRFGAFELRSFKSYLFFCCDMALGKLSPGYADFIGSLRHPKTDKYSSVRVGDVFLSADEESSIVEYLDSINSRDISLVEFDEIRSACALCMAYQHGVRPIQMAKVRLSDVRIFAGEDDNHPVVHITFLRAKQRTANKRIPMIRKVKREWANIFERLYYLRMTGAKDEVEKEALKDSLLGLTPGSVSRLISNLTDDISGIRRTPNHLRHSAAQRLVDAGASQVELAEFMGHSYADTGLVYFDASPTQASRINKALSLSPIYSKVAEVAIKKTISKGELLRVAPGRQIGGVPHGIPIAGIGSCESEQALCSKNPVLSCYSCRKFMAVADIDVHREVLFKLRGVVRQFYDASKGEPESPAYVQLRRTLESVQSVISQLDEEPGSHA